MTVVVGELGPPIIFCEVTRASDNWQVTRRGRLGLITYLSWCQKCGHWVSYCYGYGSARSSPPSPDQRSPIPPISSPSLRQHPTRVIHAIMSAPFPPVIFFLFFPLSSSLSPLPPPLLKSTTADPLWREYNLLTEVLVEIAVFSHPVPGSCL